MPAAVIYAKDLPAGTPNRVESVALVGATGQQGSHILKQLLASPALSRLQVTALTRKQSGSANQLKVEADARARVRVLPVNYDDHAELVRALRGKDVLLCTLSVHAPPEQQNKLVDAAKEAGVKWFIPNEWGYDPPPAVAQDTMIGLSKSKERAHIQHRDLPWIAFAPGFWYSYSLSGGEALFGIDINNRKAVLYQGGEVALSTSTWQRTARAVASLLSLPMYPRDEADASITMSHWLNRFVHISSFTLTQREMLDSVQQVTHTTDADWTIDLSTSAREAWQQGTEELRAGNRMGFAQALYSRMFYPEDQPGNLKDVTAVDNQLLGLPKEDLEEHTRQAVDMAKENYMQKSYARK
ncbi:NAD(P)-binding protein [Ceraceosorus guamensis]|uniref:NAD(P)-binding protein n=1 Tax=Ceraceosorus guamensis TaxID=1522189 RepID=A0A316VSD1_9BASI|nr:NAD(P)-binding protein [Ceraceosorus guamensis]PWN40270.1 NAD(P)-binding protein [Ceraceosorus guamensis]